MRLVGALERNIYTNGNIVNSDSFKDKLVDDMLEIRDKASDNYGEIPIIAMSRNTFTWFKKLFQKDSSYKETLTNTLFWLMDVRVFDMRDGLIDFYIEDDK